MQKIKRFVCSVESKLYAVLHDLNTIIRCLSEVNMEIADIQKKLETQPPRQSAVDAQQAHNDIFIFPYIELHAVVTRFNEELIKALAFAGVRLDTIRDEVISAKTELGPSPSSDALFQAIDTLIAELDNMCSSIAGSLRQISTTLRSLQDTSFY